MVVKYVDYTSDSVEFYPKDNNLFVCGTYQIEAGEEEYKERRKGRLYLYEIDSENDELIEHQTIEYPSGILDLKFHTTASSENLLGSVMSRGDMSIYSISCTDKSYSLNTLHNIQVTDDTSILALSLDWRRDGKEIVVSQSDGTISLVDVNSMKRKCNWKAHSYEAWISAYDHFNGNIIFTGGDDGRFIIWDSRCCNENESEDEQQPISTINKRNDMGITSIHSSPHDEHIVAVGSYDEKLRIYDQRSMARPLIQTESLSGGVWRIKWHPTIKNTLVTACMSGGFHILQSESGNLTDLSILESYNSPHQSIAYGVDWSFKQNEQQKQYIGCCSFYDKCLSIWYPNKIN